MMKELAEFPRALVVAVASGYLVRSATAVRTPLVLLKGFEPLFGIRDGLAGLLGVILPAKNTLIIVG